MTRSPDVFPRAGEKGLALVLVLVCLLALSGLVMASAELAFKESQDNIRLREEYQADLLGEAGLEIAKELLTYDAYEGYDTTAEPWAYPVKQDGVTVTIEPCNARLNVNFVAEDDRVSRALHWLLWRTLLPEDRKNGAEFVAGNFAFTRSAGMRVRLQDYIDEDNDERIEGTESTEYEGGMIATQPPNRKLNLPEEVLLVRFWATIPPEWINKNLTVWSDDAQVNLNFIDEEMFKAMFGDIEDYWDEFHAYQTADGFKNVSELRNAIPILATEDDVYTDVIRYATVSSSIFRVMVDVDTPLVHEQRRYILDREGNVVRGDVLTVQERNEGG